jgi:hypothetical protein
MLRQNRHNSLIITPPQFAGIVNGKRGNPIFIVEHKGRAQSALRGPLDYFPHTISFTRSTGACTPVLPTMGGGAALFCTHIEIHEIHK